MILESIRPPSPGKEGLAMSAQNKFSRIDEWILQKIYRAVGEPSVRLGFRNSAEVSSRDALPVAKIVVEDRKTLLRLLLDPEAEFGDAYSMGRIRLEEISSPHSKSSIAPCRKPDSRAGTSNSSRSAWNMFSATPCAARVVISSDTTILILIFTGSG